MRIWYVLDNVFLPIPVAGENKGRVDFTGIGGTFLTLNHLFHNICAAVFLMFPRPDLCSSFLALGYISLDESHYLSAKASPKASSNLISSAKSPLCRVLALPSINFLTLGSVISGL